MASLSIWFCVICIESAYRLGVVEMTFVDTYPGIHVAGPIFQLILFLCSLPK